MKAMSASQVDQDEQLGEETEADPQQRDVREFMVRSAEDTAGSSSASGSRAVGAAANAGVHGGTVLAEVLSSCVCVVDCQKNTVVWKAIAHGHFFAVNRNRACGNYYSPCGTPQ